MLGEQTLNVTGDTDPSGLDPGQGPTIEAIEAMATAARAGGVWTLTFPSDGRTTVALVSLGASPLYNLVSQNPENRGKMMMALDIGGVSLRAWCDRAIAKKALQYRRAHRYSVLDTSLKLMERGFRAHR